MTILEAINQIDNLKHNTYSRSDKLAWLSRLDHMIVRLIMETHEGADTLEFAGYGDNTPLDTVLLVPAPFDEIYLRWLEAQMDYANGEYERYNNSIAMYQAAYDGYAGYYNRTHMPKGRKIRYF